MSLPNFTKVGRICKDIELTYTQGGKEIAKTSIVFSEKYQDKENTCFIDVVAFAGTAKTLSNYFQKGHRIEGVFKLTQEKWTAQDGTNKSKHSLVLERIGEFIEQKGQSQMEYNRNDHQQDVPNVNANTMQPQIDIDEDEIPF